MLPWQVLLYMGIGCCAVALALNTWGQRAERQGLVNRAVYVYGAGLLFSGAGAAFISSAAVTKP